MTRPDFLVIGHVVKDVVAGGWCLGGTVTYASFQAMRLGLRPAIVTSAPKSIDVAQLLPGVEVHRVASRRVTTFRNCYDNGKRTQFVLARGRPLSVSDIPDGWRDTPIVLLGPVCGEVPTEAAAFFSASLLGVSAQGWLRRVDDQQRVVGAPWPESESWRNVRALFVSVEDVAGDAGLVERWASTFPLVACTDSSRGARIHVGGKWRHIGGVPEHEVDATGAGDVFASAFLVRLYETKDVAVAARFATVAAGMSVGGEGALGIAERGEIEARMARHPEIELQ